MLTGSKQMKQHDSDGQRSLLRQIGLFSVIVADLLGYTGAGVALGYLLWSKWGAPWWVLILTSLAGLVLAFYRLYQMSNKETR